jgi:hypothetical protein
MAGSYNHIVDDDGNLLDNERFVGMIENLGDAYEMAEHMFGMIWFLAGHREDPRMAVVQACQNYRQGLTAARLINGGEDA